MNDENAEKLGKASDTIDNLIHAMQLPLPPATHLAALKASLPALRDELRKVYVSETGQDPWTQ